MNQTNTILITGAAGFIGSHLVDRLLATTEAQIVGLDNFCDFYDPQIKRKHIAPALTNDRFTLVETDLRDRQAILDCFATHKPTKVVHLAAMAGVRPSIENPALYTAVNLDGTTHLLDASIANDCQGFVFASSSSVYGNNPKVPFAETDNVDNPISPYAATKKAGELIGHTYHHLYQLPFIGLRFFTVFGPRQRPDLAISKFLQIVAKGETIPMFGDGTSSRDYTYIDDIIEGVVASIDKADPSNTDHPYRIYNLGGSSPVTLKEMIDTVSRVVGKPANIEQHPMQAGDVNRTWADLDRSNQELGYQPSTSLEVGITKQWDWLQTQL